MSDKPRWFHRINIYNTFYEEFNNLINLYNNGTNSNNAEQQELFNSMKTCYVFYWKILKDILKSNNMAEHLPVKIFALAQKEGLIDDADIWTDFIADVNELSQTTLSELIQERTHNIIEKYKDKFEHQNKILNKYLSDSNLQDDEQLKEFDIKTKPKYKPSDLGITKTSYKKFINFLKKTNYIKYVWLHGSRSKGTATPASDIDLLADYPAEKQTELSNQLNLLYIPYRIDCANIRTVHEDKPKTFIRQASVDAKLIYRAEDFE